MHRWLCALLLGPLLAGCESASWAAQAAWGQMTLLGNREPIAAVIENPATTPELRARLRTVRELRGYAGDALGMRKVRGFDSYVATGREFVVWNVVAAPEFSVDARQWCFPVAGCVNYRGYFRRADAERFAARLALRGFDTDVYGVAAYSTLGWFDDPVLDTWVMRSEAGLAALLFHEMAHQIAYAPDDTPFSEGFARVVEREGVRRWLHSRGREADYAAYQQAQSAEARFSALLEAARARLESLYLEPLDPGRMRVQKALVLEQLRADYRRISADWPAAQRFDRWMSVPLSNARLASVANYERWVGALQRLLRDNEMDLPAFYAAVRQLAALAPDARNARLLALGHEATMNATGTPGE